MKRSMYAGRVREEHIGQELTLKGWVSRRRDLGGLIFIDLRDREGIMQLVINPETVSSEVMATAESLRSEYVIEVTGQVAARQQANDKIATGDKLRKSTGEEYTLIVSGDINNDGDVNIKDIVMLRKYLLERNNLDENSLLAADCNLDGKDISIKDLIRMRLIALERDVN